MTLKEYRTKLISINYEVYELKESLPTSKNRYEDEERLIALYKERLQLTKDCKQDFSFTLNENTREIIMFTKEIFINRKEELQQVFNYYDSRNKSFALVPKSLYKIYPDKVQVKQLPKELRTHKDIAYGARGFEITMDNLSMIMEQDTYLMYLSKQMLEKQAKLIGKTDFRPTHNKL